MRFGITGPLKYTMDVDDAIELCRALSPRTVVPVHYEGWSHFTQGRDTAAAHLAGAADVEKTVVSPDEARFRPGRGPRRRRPGR